MEAIALVPTIEALLVHNSKEKKKQAIDLIIKNVGLIGFLLKDILVHIRPEDHAEEKELFHLISAMICFYTQNYDECVRHTILSKNEWFKASESHCETLDLYFQGSRNRVIRTYIETHSRDDADMKAFIEALLSAKGEGSNDFSLLGLYIVTKSVESIAEFVRNNRQMLRSDTHMQFLVDEARRERIYSKIFPVLVEMWESEPSEEYASVFYKALLSAYMHKRDEQALKGLLNSLSEKRTEMALFIAFLLHDQSPALSQAISEDVKHPAVNSLLVGRFQSKIYQKFLSEKNQSNFALLAELSKSQSSKLSMNHMSLSFCNGVMNCKTANDTYLRKNLEWMRQAKNWSKFVVASSFGMIHTDSEDPFEMLRHYLPMVPVREFEKDDPESGGALLALGIISVNSPALAGSFLSTFLDAEMESRRNHILHGVCLGLGLARLGTCDEESINRFKTVLYSDAVTASEAAAYAIGLVCAGKFSMPLASELITYARDTEHEKISRAVGVGISLQLVGMVSSAEEFDETLQFIDDLIDDSNYIFRYAGALALGSAYVATGDLSVVGRLLSIISTDSSEDVKKVCVFSIGLILTTCPETAKDSRVEDEPVLFKVLEPLAQSHSSYVRSGVALALGMFLAGSGNRKALEAIEVLMYDSTPYVRQMASIGAGMILMQNNACDDPFYKRIVEHMHSMTKRKSESGAARFGALLGRSLLDTCGRNGHMSIFGMSGDLSVKSVCGAIMFSEFWYWYPLVPFITLCMRPTLLLAVDTDLNVVSEYSVEVDGPEKPYRITTVPTSDGKKHHKKFKILPLSGDIEKKVEKAEEDEQKAEESVEKSHTVKNFERFTPAQQRRSCLAGSPSVIFLPKAEKESHAPVQDPHTVEGDARMAEK
ncbi:26S proteasome regulatory subunit N2 [Nematocida major]|uniref:26S proteasome regulatory subunit N2 n=1 Tax=Nematocida major TaxID=1912982 RepID=UPI002007F6B4|nr:26S proteasome regulatory subunit N2 [Nematocida major]KAH9385998.1 26S proteasome regulatory subunit N2 [Nematocida major]